jgi:phage gp29-like protein
MDMLTRARAALGAAAEAWRAPAPVRSGLDITPTKPTSLTGPAPEQDKIYRVLGAMLSPSTVNNCLRYADYGHMQQLCDLLTEYRSKVTHLASVLSTREKAVAGCAWQVLARETPGKRKQAEAQRQADYVTTRLNEIPQFRDRIEHLAGGIYFGRSACEIVWKRDANGIGIRELVPVHPRRLSYTRGWDLHVWDASGNRGNPALGTMPGLPITSEDFVVCSPRTTGAEYPNRQGLGYGLVWACLFWTWTTRDWMQFAELHARPWRVATVSPEADTFAIDEVNTILNNLVTTGVATFPPGITPQLLSPAGNHGQSYRDLRDVWDSEISKVVLGQTGTTELGDKGSYAATKIHDLVRGDIKKADGVSISTAMNGLVEELVRRQFGTIEFCPVFELITTDAEAKDSEFERVMALVDHGVAISADEARERYTPFAKPPDGAESIGDKEDPADATDDKAPESGDGPDGAGDQEGD